MTTEEQCDMNLKNMLLYRARRVVRTLLPEPPHRPIDADAPLHQMMQRNLVTQYSLAARAGIAPYRDIRDSGFRLFSQFEEDGIVLYILSMIGFKTRKVVEIGIGDATECMATNLIINHGFEGFLFDGNASDVPKAQRFFADHKDCFLRAPAVTHAWITRDNINDVLRSAGAAGEVDLFSMDIDGNDYWIWDAIDAINPRLLLFETNSFIPSDRSLTIPYDPNFRYLDKHGPEIDFRSASILATTQLCNKKGYRLIGGHRHGFNIFYLRNDEGQHFFPEVTVDSVRDNPYTREAEKTRWAATEHMPWVEI
jgi:hypothetical protein